MTPPRWRTWPLLRVLALELGPAGLAGLALLAAAVGAHWVLVHDAREEAVALGTEVQHLRARRLAQAGTEPVVAPAQALERFQARFPARAALAENLGAIERLAREHRVALSSGEYRLFDEAAPGLARYELRLPLKGAWRDVVRLIAAVLNGLPHASLDELAIKRESRAAGAVEAQVRLSLHLRAATEPAAAAGVARAIAAPPPRGAGARDG